MRVLYTVFFPDISDTSSASATNVFVAHDSITAITQWLFIPSELRQEASMLLNLFGMCIIQPSAKTLNIFPKTFLDFSVPQ
jgi:hypothetical protein